MADDQILDALEKIAAGDWDGAHDIVQSRSDPAACRVHALLHRIEGDLGNAGYWYRMAGFPMPSDSVEEERERLLVELAQH